MATYLVKEGEIQRGNLHRSAAPVEVEKPLLDHKTAQLMQIVTCKFTYQIKRRKTDATVRSKQTDLSVERS